MWIFQSDKSKHVLRSNISGNEILASATFSHALLGDLVAIASNPVLQVLSLQLVSVLVRHYNGEAE